MTLEWANTSSRRDSGTPIMSQMINRGIRAETSVTRSNEPSPASAFSRAAAITDRATRVTSDSSASVRRGVNACAAMRRILV